MNQLDELFSEKLSNHTLTPPAGAWNKVETKLSKKNKAIVWMRWAAVLMLGLLAASVLWTQKETPVNQVAEKKIENKSIEQPAKQAMTAILDKEVSKKEEEDDKPRQARKRNMTVQKTAMQEPVVIVSENQQLETDVEESLSVESVSEVALAEITEPQEKSETEPAKRSQRMVLTYTLDPVIPISPAVAATDDNDKKGSSLKKVVRFAKDVKNGDSSFGLRGMKDDLLALDLKKKSPIKKH